MSDAIRLFKHDNYTGSSVWWAGPNSSKGTPRIKGFTHQLLEYSGLCKQISSLKIEEVHPERTITMFLFKDNDFEGDFVAFTSQKPGRDIPSLSAYNFNDKTASILMTSHSSIEHLPIPIGVAFSPQVTEIVDQELKTAIQSRGLGVSRRGSLVFTWEMRPHFAQYKMLVQIDIPLTVEIAMWPDYDALVSFYIYPYLDGENRLRGQVAYVKGWVEGGILSGSISSQLQKSVNSSSVTGKIEQELNDLLGNLDYQAWQDFYLMPGNAPVYGWQDYTGNTKDDVTLVLVPHS
jgi:hypothetical protein